MMTIVKTSFMITCPNCNYENPAGASQCEACYTPLPQTTTCPSCGVPVSIDATFCGSCGYNLKEPEINIPDPDLVTVGGPKSTGTEVEGSSGSALPPTVVSGVNPPPIPDPVIPPPISTPPDPISFPPQPDPLSYPPPPNPDPVISSFVKGTVLQSQPVAKLFHIQTNQEMELPQNLSVIHIGKPNDKLPPDIDLSGLPNSEVVSRIHADLKIEGDTYYLEDTGSANGTYVNHTILPVGNRHRLRPGDRIAFGKGDLVSFTFQISV